MKNKLHLTGSVLSTLCIGLFFTSTILVELFGSPEHVAAVKRLIVCPGLFILVPAIAATGVTGILLSKSRKNSLAKQKKKRMPFIAANGIFILIPAAIFLDQLASSGFFGAKFYIIQALELTAGGSNLILMGMNMRDGLKMTGKLRSNTKR